MPGSVGTMDRSIVLESDMSFWPLGYLVNILNLAHVSLTLLRYKMQKIVIPVSSDCCPD